MKLCFIYRSSKKEGLYLYIEKRDDFSRVPVELMQNFATPILAMQLDLQKVKKLAAVDVDVLKQSLSDSGFYLQVPPPIERLNLTDYADEK